jgi:hypothetical protein
VAAFAQWLPGSAAETILFSALFKINLAISTIIHEGIELKVIYLALSKMLL